MSYLLFYSISSLSSFLVLLLVEDTFSIEIINEENNVPSNDNNDELSYIYCQSLPWASPRALRGMSCQQLREERKRRRKILLTGILIISSLSSDDEKWRSVVLENAISN